MGTSELVIFVLLAVGCGAFTLAAIVATIGPPIQRARARWRRGAE